MPRFGGVMLEVASDNILGLLGFSCQSDLQKGLIVRVWQPDRKRTGRNRDAVGLDLVQQGFNALGVEVEFLAKEDFPVLGQNPGEVTRNQLASSHQTNDLARWAEGLSQAGHEDDRVQDDLPGYPAGLPDGRDLGVDLRRRDGGCTALGRKPLDLRHRQDRPRSADRCKGLIKGIFRYR